MPRKFNLTLSLLFLPFCNLIAQTSTKINKAELFICEEKYAESAAIYDNFLSEKVELFNQDYYNAALCHIKLDNFEAAKAHLNKLAQRGVNSGELTVFADLVNAYDWGNYMLVYDQILEYSDKENEYTAFELELKAIGDEIKAFQKQFLQYAFRVERLDDGTVKFIQQGKVIGVSTTDSLGRLLEPRILQDIQDSLDNTVEYKTLLKEVDQCKNKLVVKFVSFLSTKPWPHESSLNSISLVSNDNIYLQTAEFTYRYAGRGFSTFSSSDRFLQTVLAKGDSVLLTNVRDKMKSILINAVKEERLHPTTAFKLLDKNRFEQYAPYKAMTLFVGDADCYELGEAIYFEPVAMNKQDKDQPIFPNLVSREDFGKKYMYQSLHPDEFIFQVGSSMEQAHFGSCESAKNYIDSKGLVKGM